MILKFMGFLDILTAVIMFLFHLGVIEGRLLLSFILYLVIKGLMFKGDTASIIDFIIAIYLIIMYVYPMWLFTILAFFYLFQKGFFSMF
ncbi:MAG: hypothetical protein ACMXX6_00480 [Candidatus Woesearchaeota archaeon]